MLPAVLTTILMFSLSASSTQMGHFELLLQPHRETHEHPNLRTTNIILITILITILILILIVVIIFNITMLPRSCAVLTVPRALLRPPCVCVRVCRVDAQMHRCLSGRLLSFGGTAQR